MKTSVDGTESMIISTPVLFVLFKDLVEHLDGSRIGFLVQEPRVTVRFLGMNKERLPV